MNALRTISKYLDALSDRVGRAVSWVTLLLVLVVFIDVIMRYAFAKSFVFAQELEWHLFAFIFLMGASCTLLHDGHVRVDIIYQSLGPKGKAWVNIVGVVFFLIPGCIMVAHTGLGFAMEAYRHMEGSPDPGGIPCRFILKSTIPIGFTLLLLQGISLGAKSLLILLGHEDVEKESA